MKQDQKIDKGELAKPNDRCASGLISKTQKNKKTTKITLQLV